LLGCKQLTSEDVGCRFLFKFLSFGVYRVREGHWTVMVFLFEQRFGMGMPKLVGVDVKIKKLHAC